MKVLVTGAGGQLGTDVVEHFRRSGDEVVAPTHAELDVGDRDQAMGVITSAAPDVVVHAGAWTAVDACESDPDRAFRDNALGTRWVVEASNLAGAHVVGISTDYVFDGTLERPYREWDRPNPRSVYGASKLAGEQELAAARSGAVVRTSWVCGAHGHNMVKTVLGLRHRDSLAFVDDQRGHPSFTSDLAMGLRRLAVARRTGTYHLTNQGAVSWFEFVQDVLRAAGADPAIVAPISTADLDPPRPAPRPANSVLDNAALRLGGDQLLPHYAATLERVVAELLAREDSP